MEEAASRQINYLRMSITDRCQLRCVYCTYWQEWQKRPPAEILRYEELLRLAAIAAEGGIRKIRITGGEPLVRRGIVGFLQDLNRIPGIDKVGLTTNGVLLRELAPAIYNAGVRHLNVSLDTLKRDRYHQITGNDKLSAVMAGLERAASLGFHPLKINCVVLRGINDDEILDIAQLAREHPFQVRFIELMPTTSQPWWQRHFLSMAEVRQRLAVLGPLEPLPREAAAGPARTFRLPGFEGELGFISPMSEHHCRTCNRLRLSSDGKVRPCLLRSQALDLKGPLRQGVSDDFLNYLFQEAIQLKNWNTGHSLPNHGLILRDLPMVGIGG